VAEPLKNFFDRTLVASIAADLGRVHPALEQAAFVREAVRGMAALTLMQRAGHIADAMHRHLPADYPEAVRLLVASVARPVDREAGGAMAPFRYLPHTMYVARHGLAHFAASMAAQHALTQHFTAEFSIRPFLVRHPAETHAQLLAWTDDPSVHVRRLVSEGTRPRLPWAERLPMYQKEPAPVLALLERLKDDAEPYVQRSVANNLNDIAKDHPDRVVALCTRWLDGATPGRRWIVKHALRSLVKRGHRGALHLLGVGEVPAVTLREVRLTPKRVRLGESLTLSLSLVSTAARAQELVVDFAVHFVKARGEPRPKVFKLKRLTLPAHGEAALGARVSFAAMTTRKHYPGVHRVDLLVNGEPMHLGEFVVWGG